MKKTILFLALALLVAGGVFAQKVGDAVKVGGKDYRLVEVRGDGNLVLQPVATLDGVWVSGPATITISGSTGVYTSLNLSAGSLGQDAANKGYVKVGDQMIRNLRKTGDLTWTGQVLNVQFRTSAPNVAIGTSWANCTITMNADSKTFQITGGGTFTRK